MTITQLIDQLERLRAEHGGTIKVCVDAEHLADRDGFGVWDIMNVESVRYEVVAQADGDGFGLTHADGSEVLRPCVILG